MKEAKFWHDLKLAVCRELDALATLGRDGLWCDGFIPATYAIETAPAQITGNVWIGVGPREHEKWKFTLTLTKPAPDRAAVEWSDLMPAYGTTGWVKVDTDHKLLAIELGAAVPIVR